MTTNVRLVKFGVIGTVALMAALFLRGCFHKPTAPIDMKQPLPQDTVMRASVSHNVVAIQTNKGVQTAYVPRDGVANIEVKKNGLVALNIKKAGFTIVPEFGVVVSDFPRGFAGFQGAYFNRFEIHGGIAYPHIVGFLGLGYRLDQLHLDNTSWLLTYDTHKYFGVGIVVRL